MTHVAFLDRELPAGRSALSEATRVGTSAHPPVFLHCGWRSRGTWIWNRFRQMPGITGYYEPLSEALAWLNPNTVATITAESWKSGHLGLTRPYFDEYRPLLRPSRAGVRSYQPGFATSDFFAEANTPLPELHGYLAGLLDAAWRRGTQPVLKLCASMGRIGWMRRRFPDAVHIVVLRDPFTQFASAQRQYVDAGDAQFLAIPLLLLARHREQPLVGSCLRHLAVELPDLTRYRSAEAALPACVASLRNSDPVAWYRGFLAFWAATAASIPEDVDLVIDSGALVRSPSYRSHREAELARLTLCQIDFADADASGDRARPDARLSRRSELLRAHAAAEAFLAERLGAAWADSRVFGQVARLLSDARAHGFGAEVAARAPHSDARMLRDADPDFDSILLAAMGRAAWAERELAIMRASRSWRLTAPLRWLRRGLR